MLIVGDIGGEFDALMKLTEKWSHPICLVGDPNDRGRQSREVIEWCIKNEKDVLLLDSNHADILCDFIKDDPFYDHERMLVRNGFYPTLASYGLPVPKDGTLNLRKTMEWARANIPKEHIEFLESRPMMLELEDAVISHAPVPWEWMLLKPDLNIDEKRAWFWNRRLPKKLRIPKWQIFGHNSSPTVAGPDSDTCEWGLMVNKKDKWICLDDSRKEKLTGMVWPEQNFVQVSFGLRERTADASPT